LDCGKLVKSCGPIFEDHADIHVLEQITMGLIPDLNDRASTGDEPVPDNSLEFLQSIYRDIAQPLALRMRAAIEALPFETPKLTAVASAEFDGRTFAELLDRAIERSHGMRLIEAMPVEQHNAEELKGPMASE
jgi:hypothetical protein